MQWNQFPAGEPLRGTIRGAIEEASGETLPVNDPLPDELIATVQALQPEGCGLGALEVWVRWCDHPEGWSPSAFARWWRA